MREMGDVSLSHSIYGMGVGKPLPPDFGSLSKQTTTVDIGRLQGELRALHTRLEMLEMAAPAAAKDCERDLDDRKSGSSGSKETVVAGEGDEDSHKIDGDSIAHTANLKSEEGAEEDVPGRYDLMPFTVPTTVSYLLKQVTQQSKGFYRGVNLVSIAVVRDFPSVPITTRNAG